MRQLVAVLVVLSTVRPCAISADPKAKAERFGRVKLLVAEGEKTKAVDAVLILEEDHVAVRRKGSAVEDLKKLPYDAMKSAEYSYSKTPRWKSGAGAAVAIGVLALPIFFMKGKRHWLTLRGTDDYAVMQLDKRNYKLILAAIETKTGLSVETVGEEK